MNKGNKFNILVVLFLVVSIIGNAQTKNMKICQSMGLILRSYIDTVKLSNKDNGEHNVYFLNIYPGDSSNFTFTLSYLSDVHLLENKHPNYYTIIDSEIVLIQDLNSHKKSITQCLNPLEISNKELQRARKKMHNENVFISGKGRFLIGKFEKGSFKIEIYR